MELRPNSLSYFTANDLRQIKYLQENVAPCIIEKLNKNAHCLYNIHVILEIEFRAWHLLGQPLQHRATVPFFLYCESGFH